MSWLDAFVPVNLFEEKAKFLADTSYNPQFIYPKPIDLSTIHKFGQPQSPYLELSQEILDRVYFGRNEADLLMSEGKRQTQAQVTRKIDDFLKLHNLNKRFKIEWSSSFVSRATINEDTLRLRTNAAFYQHELLGMIYHEIGTHALRRVNYEQQSWFKKKKKYGLIHSYLRTEEGLSNLHSLLPRQIPSAYSSAIRYQANHYALSHSFSEVWDWLGQYIDDPETRWMVAFRQKRGFSDTSQPGAFSKDIVYFEGAVQVWHWLKTENYNPTRLYLGKIALEDVALAEQLSPGFMPLLPRFYTMQTEKYAERLAHLGEYNQFDQVAL